MCNLEKLEVTETALGCLESPSNCFYLSPDIAEGFGMSGSCLDLVLNRQVTDVCMTEEDQTHHRQEIFVAGLI